MLIALVALSVWLVLRDDPPPDDSDLILPPLPAVPLEESVYGAIVGVLADLPEWQEWDAEFWRQVEGERLEYRDLWKVRPIDRASWDRVVHLDAMDEYHSEVSPRIDRIADALGRHRGGWPAPDPVETSGPTPVFERAGNHLRTRALIRRAAGDTVGASQDIETLLRLSESVMVEGPRSCLHGVAACNDAFEAWRLWVSLLHDGELDPEVEARILASAPILDRDSRIIAKCLREAYGQIRARVPAYEPDEATIAFGGHPLLLRIFYKPNRTLATCADGFRHDLAQIELPPPKRTPAEAWSRSGSLRRSVLRANSGDWIIAHYLVDGFVWSFDYLRLESRAVRTLVALRAHERACGALPADLAQLIVAFPALGSLPIDPYSGAPFGYDPARRILWSVGEDGVDGGGDGWEELQDDPEASRYGLPDWIWPISPLPGGG